MLSLFVVIFQCINNNFQMLFIAEKIGVRCINEKRFYIMVFDVMCVGLLNIEQVFIRDILFVGPIPFFNILL